MPLTLPTASRRGFLGFLLAAPAIVTAANIMPVKVLPSVLQGEFLPELLEPATVSEGLLTPSIIAREFARIVAQNLQRKGTRVEESSIFASVGVVQQKHVDFRYFSQDRKLSLDDFRTRLIEPAATTMADSIASDAAVIRTRKMDLPLDIFEAARESVNGVESRFVSDYNITVDEMISRFDISYSVESRRGLI